MGNTPDFFEFLAPPTEAAEYIFDDYNKPRECETCGKLFTKTDCPDKRFCSVQCGNLWLKAEQQNAKEL